MEKGKGRKKKIIILVSAVVIIAAIVAISLIAGKQEKLEVQTSKVAKKELLEAKVSASGEIRAKEFVEIQTEIAGVVVEIPVKEGDFVKKGDMLLRIDPVQTKAEYEAIEAQYAAATSDAKTQEVQIATAQVNLQRDEAQIKQTLADLEQARNNYTRAKNSFDRVQQLNEENLVSRDDYERAQNEVRSYKSQIDIAQARLEQLYAQNKVTKLSIDQMKSVYQATNNRANAAKANLARSQDMLKKTTIYSPLTGIITKKNVEIGERAVPGIMSNPQATLLIIADLSVIQVELKVDETDIVNIGLGNSAKVKVDALPDKVIEGKVTEIGSSPIQTTTASQEAKDFKVIVELTNPPPELKTGLSATAEIITKTKQSVLTIPFQALTVREVEVNNDGKYIAPAKPQKTTGTTQAASADNDGKKKNKKKELQGVFIIDKESRARFRPLETGITGETDIEVLKGLELNDEIISGSYKTIRTLEEWATVKVNNAVKTAPTEK
jgi:HlyD family secretion protein